MPSLVDEVKKVLCVQGVDAECLHPKTVKFIEECESSATVLYMANNGIASRQVKAVVAASAKQYDDLFKEVEEIKKEVHGIRESIREE
jgi:hypothetical protein